MSVELHNQDCMEFFKTLQSESIDLVVTDPPYHVITGGRQGENRPRGMLDRDEKQIFKYNDIEPETWFPEVFRVLKSGSHCYIMTNTLNLERYLTLARTTGFELHNLLVWEKNNCTPSQWYMKNCEYTLFLRKGAAKPINNIGCKTVHLFDNPVGEKIHPTEKPIELMKMYVTNSSQPNDLVLDPFFGSGAVASACKQTFRNFVGCEIDPEFYAVAKARVDNIALPFAPPM